MHKISVKRAAQGRALTPALSHPMGEGARRAGEGKSSRFIPAEQVPTERCASRQVAAILAGLWLLGVGCGHPPESERGVRLLFTDAFLEPTTTLEFRFDEPAVEADQVGTVAAPAPLRIKPELPGEWTWLSRRSGVFRPSAPPRLDCAYRISLAWRNAQCERVLRTPAFGFRTELPYEFDTNDAPVSPRLPLYFNAAIAATDVASLLTFRDGAGRRVPALVRHATPQDEPIWSRAVYGSDAAWTLRFVTSQPAPRGVRTRGETPDVAEAPPELAPHALVVAPAQPLPPGTGWRLQVRAGLAAIEPGLRLTEDQTVWLGTIRPFAPTQITPQSSLYAGRRLVIGFSKPLSPELDATNVLAWFSVSPAPENLRAALARSQVNLEGDFRLDARYTVTVRRGLPAREPMVQTQDVTAKVAFAPLPPRLYFPFTTDEQLSEGQRRFDLLALNAPGVRLRAKGLEDFSLVPALRGYRSYFRERSWDNDAYEPFQGIDFNVLPGRTIWQSNFTLRGELDDAVRTTLVWDTVLGGRRPGAVFLEAVAEEGGLPDRQRPGTQAIVQLTDLGLYWKRSDSNLWALAFSYRSGLPLAGVKLRLVTDENELLADGESSGTGLAELPLDARAAWIVAAHGEDLRAAEVHRHDLYVDGSRIPVRYAWDTETATRRVLLFSERPVYRPGETLHLKALARDRGAAGWEIPRNLQGRLRVYDARSRKFHEAEAPFSALGSWDADVALPDQVRGTYRVELHLGTNEVQRHYFQVQDYTPDAFAVVLKAPESFAAGQPVAVPVEARYLFGDEVARGSLHWTVRAEDDGFAPAGFEGFSFGPPVYANGLRYGGAPETFHGETNYVRGQRLVLAPEIAVNPTAPQPRAVELLVELTDLNQQTISRHTRFRRHSSSFYLGLWPGTTGSEAGQPWPVHLVAVDASGQPWTNAVTAQVTFQRVEWRTVRVQGAGGSLDYRSEATLQPLSTNTVLCQLPAWTGKRWEPAAGVEPALALTPPTAGQYLIEARARDEAGREVMTASTFYVSGRERLAWDYRSPALLELVPERTNYLAGETAMLMLKAPFSGAAVVSLEQERVLRSFVTNLTGNAPALRVPLAESDAPAVYVSVMLLRGLADSPRAVPEPEYALGYCQLNVERPETRLDLALTLTAADVLPGAPVPVALRAQDGAGAPVADAEVTLYAVDEGVLNLMDYAAPDPHTFFHAPRPLAVWPHCTLPALFPEDPEHWEFFNKGYLVGGGGKGGEALRKEFLACAYWSANLRTDTEGRLTATFKAPDSLTRYRVFAVAQTARHQFGSAEAGFRVNKPLMLQPVPPAFANAGDRLVVRAVVHNRTDQAGSIEVTIEPEDPRAVVVGVGTSGAAALRGADPTSANPPPSPNATQQVHIEAHAAATVDFPAEFRQPGLTRWIWRARFVGAGHDGFTDAVQTPMPVNDPAPVLREVHLTRNRAPRTNLLAMANPQLLEGAKGREVVVRVSNSRVGELGDAVQHLLHYPYGCAEQTVSSLLPWLALAGFTNSVPALARTLAETRDAIEHGLNRLLFMQTDEGGLAFWPGGREPGLWISAYAGVAFGLARREGHEPPVERMDRLYDYLRRELSLSGRLLDGEELAERTLALWALALAERPEPGYVEALFAQRHRMSAETRALLALSLPETDTERLEELLRPKVPLPAREDHGFGCAARELALSLLGWCHAGPDRPEADRCVEELLAARQDGHWVTTQGNAWALLALAAYARHVEGALEPARGMVSWAADTRRFEFPATVQTFEATFQDATVGVAPPLWLENPEGQRWFAQATITGHAAVREQPRQDRGFSIRRRYDVMADDGSPHPFADARVGDRVLVTLRFEVRQAAHFVAVDDPFPALFEAVNPEFKSRATAADEEVGGDWISDYRELRADRALFFCDHLPPGTYLIRYLARVRCAGEALAPAAKIEEMYHPERFGLTETLRVRAVSALYSSSSASSDPSNRPPMPNTPLPPPGLNRTGASASGQVRVGRTSAERRNHRSRGQRPRTRAAPTISALQGLAKRLSSRRHCRSLVRPDRAKRRLPGRSVGVAHGYDGHRPSGGIQVRREERGG